MKKFLKDLTLHDVAKICSNHKCSECPFFKAFEFDCSDLCTSIGSNLFLEVEVD